MQEHCICIFNNTRQAFEINLESEAQSRIRQALAWEVLATLK